MSRAWAMPSPDTLSIPPIRQFAQRYLTGVTVDPFARNSRLAHWRNDLSPATDAEYHMDAADFCDMLAGQGLQADCAIFDPPYSPRQITECYQSIGRKVTGKDTQNAALYKRVRDALNRMVRPGGVVLSFGWNSAGMGRTRGYEITEILLCAHGGGHNDTICVAETKVQGGLDL